MAYRRLLLLRSPAQCPKFCYPSLQNRAEVLVLHSSFKISTNLGIRSFGTFAKAKKFVQRFNNPWFSRIFRVFRMSSLLFGIGGAAYTYGQVQLLEDPIGHHEKTLHRVLSSLNARFCVHFLDNEDLSNDKISDHNHAIEICKEGLIPVNVNASYNIKAATAALQRVFLRVKDGARRLLQEQELLLQQQAEQGKNVSDALVLCRRNLQSMRNPWTIVLVDDACPNAMVCGLLPRVVFVTTGLFDHFAKDDSQLALVLGHELSHYLLRHGNRTGLHEAILKGVVLCAIALIDPSGGLGMAMVELLLPYVGTFLELQYSRNMEYEADEMGQKIACASCYPPEDSIKMLDNMIRFQHEAGGATVAMLSTHPVGEDRQCQACKQVEELQHKYDVDSDCHHTQKLLRML